MRNTNHSLAAYTFSHFCIDYACFFMLFGPFRAGLSQADIATGYLLYNIIAFGLQAPVGAFCDSHKRAATGLTGCVLVAAGLLLCYIFKWPGLCIAALGNAFFHVEGGIDSLVHSRGRMTRSGIFVSSGALGVGLGTLSGKLGGWMVIVPLVLLLVSFFAIKLLGSKYAFDLVYFGTGTGDSYDFGQLMLMLFFAVMIRSYGGFIVQAPWKADYLLLPAAGAALGKAMGGMLADGLGARKVGVGSLLLSIPLLCLGWRWPVSGFAGMVLFNMNMPITLCAVSDKLPGHPGLAFGVTTLALLCGSILPFFYTMPQTPALIMLAVLSAASAWLINKSLTLGRAKKRPSRLR